jgi:hypothetical protein
MSWIHAAAKAQQRRVMRRPVFLSTNTNTTTTTKERARKKFHFTKIAPNQAKRKKFEGDGILLHRVELQQLVVQHEESSATARRSVDVLKRVGRVAADRRGVKLPLL